MVICLLAGCLAVDRGHASAPSRAAIPANLVGQCRAPASKLEQAVISKLPDAAIIDFDPPDFKAAPFECKPGKPQDVKSLEGDACRLSPQFIVAAVTQKCYTDLLGQHGFRLRHAFIDDSLDLSQLDIQPQIWLDSSLVAGNIDASNAHLHRSLSLDGTVALGKVFAERLTADSAIFIRHQALIGGGADFSSAIIHGDLNLTSSSFGDDVMGLNAHVDGDVMLGDDPKGNSVIQGDVKFVAASIDGRFVLERQAIIGHHEKAGDATGGSLYLGDLALKNTLRATTLVVESNVDIGASEISGNMGFDGAQIGGNFDSNATTVGRTFLSRISGQKPGWQQLYPNGSQSTGVHPSTPGFSP